jgi:hypothetical protein
VDQIQSQQHQVSEKVDLEQEHTHLQITQELLDKEVLAEITLEQILPDLVVQVAVEQDKKDKVILDLVDLHLVELDYPLQLQVLL